MNFNRNALFGFATFILAALGLVIWEARMAQAAQARLSAASRRLADITLDLRKTRSSIAQLSKDQELLKKSLAAAKSETAIPLPGMDTPKQQQARVHLIRAWLELRNRAMYRKLGLTPGQIEEVESLAVSHFLRVRDIVATAQAENIPMSDPAIVSLMNGETQQYQQEQTASLGAEMAQDIQQYQRTAAVRTVANELAGDTYFTEAPLTVQQGDQLTQILANNSAGYQKGGSAGLSDINMVSALAQAQGILSPAQFAALNNSYQGKQAGATMNRLLLSLTQGAAPAHAP